MRGVDQAIAIVALLFEAIAFEFRKLPNCVFALHRALPQLLGSCNCVLSLPPPREECAAS